MKCLYKINACLVEINANLVSIAFLGLAGISNHPAPVGHYVKFPIMHSNLAPNGL